MPVDMPGCCKDDMKSMIADGKKAGAAMMTALANHKAGKHKDADKDDDGDNDK